MRVLIIGGTTFMGPHVVRYLKEAGHEVVVFHRGKNAACGDDPQHIHGDRRQLPQFRSRIEALAPDVVVHMVAMDQNDADATFQALSGLVRRVVLISSIDVYHAYGRFIGVDEGPVDNAPVREDAPLRVKRFPYRSETVAADSPLHDYDKIVVEEAFLGNPDFSTTVLRLPAVFGPEDRQHRTREYVTPMRADTTVKVVEEMVPWRWSRGYVEDVAWGIFLAATHDPPHRIYNIAEPAAQTELEWVQQIGVAMHWTGEIAFEPGKEKYEWSQDIVADSSLIRADLGYRELVDPDEAMRRTVEWEVGTLEGAG